MEIVASSQVVSPVQFPSIVNPNIYIHNMQAAPIYPQMNAPPVNLNLHVKGLEEYYKPKPRVFHVHENHHQIDLLGQLVD